jgi:hypothetical protein
LGWPACPFADGSLDFVGVVDQVNRSDGACREAGERGGELPRPGPALIEAKDYGFVDHVISCVGQLPDGTQNGNGSAR